MAVLEKIEEKYLVRINDLIQFGEGLPIDKSSGESLKATARRSVRLEQRKFKDVWLDAQAYNQWFIRVINLLSSLPIKENHYKTQFENSVRGRKGLYRNIGLGILEGLYKDIENGDLQKGIELAKAEVFTDFLDMADHLLGNGYKDPAAFLIGAVLEGELRNLCKRNSIEFKEGDGINSLNSKLADNNIYTSTVRSQIQAWKKIRDSADHKKFDDYTENQVKDFLSGVRKFIGEYLG